MVSSGSRGKALAKVYGKSRHQRCWVHETANVLNKLPRATECLEKDRQELLAFYDFPAAHWQHIRTTNPIESTFATVRLRTRKTRGRVSRQKILALVFQLGQSALKRGRRLRGYKLLADIMNVV